MLNSTYNFISAILANRLKATLETVVNPDQTGFIANRFIGDNTQLLYDTINCCEMENKEGLIIVLDFAKAFDTIEWSYIYSCMEMFGYGDKSITMVKLLHNESTSVVENNGNFSNNIPLSRGCRQGIRYPCISSYFVRKFYLTVSGNVGTLRVLRYMAQKYLFHNMRMILLCFGRYTRSNQKAYEYSQMVQKCIRVRYKCR